MAIVRIIFLMYIAAIGAVSAQQVNFKGSQFLSSPGTGLLGTALGLIFPRSQNTTVTVLELVFPPGNRGDVPHSHSGPVMGYVLEGDFLFQVQGEKARVVSAGNSFFEKYGAVHLWGANASGTKGAKAFVAVFGTPGAAVVQYVNATRDDYATALQKAKSLF